MKKYSTRRIYRVRCQSNLIGYRTRLQNNYKNFKEWESYSSAYGLAKRLGFNDEIQPFAAMKAWKANPVIEGSINPSDFRKVAK